MFPSPSQNAVGVCKQITLVILYYISSRLVTLLKVTDAPVQASHILGLTVGLKFVNFRFKILLFVSEISTNFRFLHCLDYLHCFGLEPVTTAFLPVAFDLKTVNILNQTTAFAA